MKKFESVKDLMLAVVSGEVPIDLASPGAAAKKLGVSRQAVWDRIHRGTLRGWSAPGVTYVGWADVRAVWREVRAQRRINEMREQRHASERVADEARATAEGATAG